MKDKERRIEEIEEILNDKFCKQEICLENIGCMKCMAKTLVDSNCVKLSENEMILTKVEKEKLLHEMYEQGRFDAIADLEKEGKVVMSREELEKLQSENKRLFYRNCNLILENQNIKEQTEAEKLYSNKEIVEKIITCLADYKEYEYKSISYKDWCVPHMVIKHIAKYFDIDISKLNDKPSKKVLTFNGVKFEE